METTLQEATPSQPLQAKPLVLAAYKYGEPYRKRRVKVPANTPWKDFLALFYSRLDLNPENSLEIFDESGVEIVSVEDLIDNDILVVREKQPVSSGSSVSVTMPPWQHQHQVSRQGVATTAVRDIPSDPFRRPHEQAPPFHSSQASPPKKAAVPNSRPASSEHAQSVMVGPPTLSHFIQCNSFGHYFLAEAENLKLQLVPGKSRKAHCVVKVPHINVDDLHVLESEAALLRRISHHKSIISPPEVHLIDFSEAKLQRFYFTVAPQKQALLQPLFSSAGQKQAYVYPLYGITMATKLKSGLPPEKVLKYAYQLADIMQYLQQKGVIHQSLLPENIQVMSNDRVIVCNFETAIQTDPNTCLMVLSGGVPPPSNRYGLSPEVLSAFARLRVESETVDYSTQYPWMFGVLSVLIATGQHPLGDYPTKYEENQKVRYRSHHIQTLPDPDKYPPVFMKLVRRSLSCDPVRRPTLQQVLSIFKRDPRILALMTGNRLPAQKPRRGSLPGMDSSSQHHRQGHARQDSLDLDDNSQQQQYQQRSGRTSAYDSRSSTAPLGLYHNPYSSDHHQTAPQQERHPPSATNPTATPGSSATPNPMSSSSLPPNSQPPVRTSSESLSRTRSEQLMQSRPGPINSDVTQGHTHLPAQQRVATVPSDADQSTEAPKEAWYTFNDDPLSNERSSASTAAEESHRHVQASTRPAYENVFPLKRCGSTGAFSDDFVLDGEESQKPSLPPRLLPRSSHATGSIPHLPSTSSSSGHQEREWSRPLNRSMEVLSPTSGSRGEEDRQLLREFRYRRLLHSPNTVSSSPEVSPLLRREGDGEELLLPGTPDAGASLVTTGESSGGKAEAKLTSPSTTATSHVRKSGNDSEEKWRSFLASKKELGPSNAMLRGTKSETSLANSTITEEAPAPVAGGHRKSVRSRSITSNNIGGNVEAVSSQASVRRASSSADVGQTIIKKETCNSGACFDAVVGDGNEPAARDHQREVSNKELWSGMLPVNSEPDKNGSVDEAEPSAGHSSQSGDAIAHSGADTLVLSGDNGESSVVLTASPIPDRLHLDIFPRALDSDSNLSGEMSLMPPVQGELASSAPQVGSAWLPLATGGSSEATTVMAAVVPVQQPSASGEEDVSAGVGYGPMSPIPEASQELTGSMSQQGMPKAACSVGISAEGSNKPPGTSSVLSANNSTTTSVSTPAVHPVVNSSTSIQSTNPEASRSINTPSAVTADSAKSPVRNSSPLQQLPMMELTRFNRSPSPAQASGGSYHCQYPNVDGNIQGSPLRQTRVQSSPIRSPTRPMSPLATSSITAPGPALQSPQESTELSSAAGNHQAVQQDSPSTMVQENSTIISQQDTTASIHQDSVPRAQQDSTTRVGESNAGFRNEQDRLQHHREAGRDHSSLNKISGSGRGSSKVRYSHQRHQDPSRIQNRIRQELEAMDSAISGMDSQNSQSLYARSASAGGWVESQRGVGGPRQSQPHSQGPLSSRPSQARHRPQQGARNHRQASGQSGRSSNSATAAPSLTKSNSTAGRSPTVPSHNNFRPITPALAAGNSRPSSAPGAGDEDGRNSSRPSSTPHSRVMMPTNGEVPQNGRHQQQQRFLQGSAHNRPHGQGVSGIRTNNQSGRGTTAEPPNIQPPQVTPGSYDYLPPYSPPHTTPNNTHHQPQNMTTATAAPVGGGSYPEPPPSYNEIFGEHEVSSLPSQSRREGNRHGGRDSRSGNRQRRRHERMHASQSDARPVTQSASNRPLGRLSSITNIFRRHHNRPSQSGGRDHPDIGLEDYTAQWVASYSHTPRPHNSQHVTPASASSRRDRPSGTPHNQNFITSGPPPSPSTNHTPSSQGSIPYVHPPPFPLSEQTHVGHYNHNPMVSGGNRGENINRSMSRLPVTSVGGNSPASPSGVRLRGQSAHDRPRPSSAYFLSDNRVFQLPNVSSSTSEATDRPDPPSSAGPIVSHLTPPQQHSRLITNAGQPPQLGQPPHNPAISASCTNIASTDRPRAIDASLRRQGSERLSRHRRQAYLERISPNRGTSNQQRSPRAMALRSGSSQNSPRGLSSSFTQRPGSGRRNANCSRSVSDVSPKNHRKIQETPSTLPEMTRETSATQGSSVDLVANERRNLTVASNSTSSPFTNGSRQAESLMEQQQNPRHNSSTNISTTSVSPLPGSVEENGNEGVSENLQQLNDPVRATNSHSSVNSVANSGTANSHSSRSAMRLRAEARRTSLIVTSSSEEDLLNELSQNTSSSHGHSRPRRRRSQGSSSFASGSQRSQDSNNQVGCHIEVREEGEEEAEGGDWPQENGGSAIFLGSSERQLQEGRNEEGNGMEEEREGSDELVRAEETSGQESASEHIIEINMVINPSGPTLPPVGKSCGHECEGSNEALCCVCSRQDHQREEGGDSDNCPTDPCSLCVRRSSSTQEAFVEADDEMPQEMSVALSDHDQSSVGCLNLKVSSQPSSPHLPQSPSSPSERARSNKNCSVM